MIIKDSIFNREQVFVLLDHRKDIRSQIRLSRKVESNAELYQIAIMLPFLSYKANFDTFRIRSVHNLAGVFPSFQYEVFNELFSFIRRRSLLAFKLL